MDGSAALSVFISAFGVASFAGLAALLRSGESLTAVRVLSSLLNSGLLGLGIALLWYHQFQDNIYFLVGVCLVAGLSGMATVDFILQALRQFGFSMLTGGRFVAPAPNQPSQPEQPAEPKLPKPEDKDVK